MSRVKNTREFRAAQVEDAMTALSKVTEIMLGQLSSDVASGTQQIRGVSATFAK